MAEIKSTLDLVMEKTRHLSFSEQEKQEQHSQENKGSDTAVSGPKIEGRKPEDRIERLATNFRVEIGRHYKK